MEELDDFTRNYVEAELAKYKEKEKNMYDELVDIVTTHSVVKPTPQNVRNAMSEGSLEGLEKRHPDKYKRLVEICMNDLISPLCPTEKSINANARHFARIAKQPHYDELCESIMYEDMVEQFGEPGHELEDLYQKQFNEWHEKEVTPNLNTQSNEMRTIAFDDSHLRPDKSIMVTELNGQQILSKFVMYEDMVGKYGGIGFNDFCDEMYGKLHNDKIQPDKPNRNPQPDKPKDFLDDFYKDINEKDTISQYNETESYLDDPEIELKNYDDDI